MIAASSNLIRTLVIYAVVLPLALLLGYVLAAESFYTSLGTVGLAIMVLCLPLLLKWHFPILLLSLNLGAVVPLMPGHPEMWLVMSFASLLVVVVQRCLLQDRRFIHAPSVLLPLISFLGVVYMTARLTNSFGLHIFGSAMVGSRYYLNIFAGAACFFAMLGTRTPQKKAVLYISLYLLGGLANAVTSFFRFLPGWTYVIYYLIPVGQGDAGSPDAVVTRFSGLSAACSNAYAFMLARFGIRNLLAPGKGWRFVLLILALLIGSLGGFRSMVISSVLTFLIVFYFEGLVRSKFFVPFAACALLGCVLLVPFGNRLPLSTQRSLAFLPIELNTDAVIAAETSSQWRIKMWKVLLPEVPQYLWLGKGLGIAASVVDNPTGQFSEYAEQEQVIQVGNFHNGPLTLLIFFGVWGAATWLWFLGASIRALYFNCRYGEDYLRTINTYLLATFIVHTLMFLFVVGDIRLDVAPMFALMGFSLSLNHGIRKPARKLVPRPIPIRARRPMTLAPGLPRQVTE